MYECAKVSEIGRVFTDKPFNATGLERIFFTISETSGMFGSLDPCFVKGFGIQPAVVLQSIN